MNKAIFLDRDGTINVDKGYTHKIEELSFEEYALDGLKIMTKKLPDYKIIILTNQAGIARGYYTEEVFHKFMKELIDILKKEKIRIDAYYFCPHHPEEGIGKYKIKCDCRKPGVGLLKKAAKEWNIDLSKSYMIGDKLADIKSGKDANLNTILVMTGHKGDDIKYEVKPDATVKNLKEAAKYILLKNN